MTVFLDYGHGSNTIGKQAVVGGKLVKEYDINRAIGEKIRKNLLHNGIPVRLTNSENFDLPLTQRIKGVRKEDVFVSIHNNAFNGKARGFEIFTTIGETKADYLADCIIDEIEPEYKARKIPLRYDLTDGDRDKESNFFVLRNTPCPAVLIEFMFFDNPKDLPILQCQIFQQKIALLVTKGILKFLETYE